MVLFGWDIWSSSDASEKKFGGGGRGGGATRTRGKVNTSPAPHPLYLPFVTIFSVLIAEEALISKAEGRY